MWTNGEGNNIEEGSISSIKHKTKNKINQPFWKSIMILNISAKLDAAEVEQADRDWKHFSLINTEQTISITPHCSSIEEKKCPLAFV